MVVLCARFFLELLKGKCTENPSDLGGFYQEKLDKENHYGPTTGDITVMRRAFVACSDVYNEMVYYQGIMTSCNKDHIRGKMRLFAGIKPNTTQSQVIFHNSSLTLFPFLLKLLCR